MAHKTLFDSWIEADAQALAASNVKLSSEWDVACYLRNERDLHPAQINDRMGPIIARAQEIRTPPSQGMWAALARAWKRTMRPFPDTLDY